MVRADVFVLHYGKLMKTQSQDYPVVQDVGVQPICLIQGFFAVLHGVANSCIMSSTWAYSTIPLTSVSTTPSPCDQVIRIRGCKML